MFIRLLIRWAITAVAVAVTTWLLPGITIEGPNSLYVILITSAVLGFVNAIIRPITMLFSCGCIAVTLGLFIFVINAAMLALASWISTNWFNAPFIIDNFWWALLGSIVISVISWLLSLLLPDTEAELTVIRTRTGR
jgi:putative membrane protein